jgi:hypothetical protein
MKSQITKTELLNQINTLRMKMIQSGLENGLNNWETINLSKQLDHLLYIYQSNHFIRK